MHSDADTDTATAPDTDAAPDTDTDGATDEKAVADAGGRNARNATGRSGRGRTIMLTLGVAVIAISGAVGWLVGSNGSVAVSEAAILGTSMTIPVTPTAVALYGIVVSTALLGVLFGLVELASRAEGDPAS